MSDIHPAEPRIFLDTVLRPYRSLPPKGFAILMGVLGGASLLGGIFWLSRGAWPVVGFFGLDVLLVYIAFRVSYRSARLTERMRLTEESFTLERAGRGDVRRWQFEPAWLRVVLREAGEDRNELVVASHGHAVTIGSFLAPAERRRVAARLQDALARWRLWIAGG